MWRLQRNTLKYQINQSNKSGKCILQYGIYSFKSCSLYNLLLSFWKRFQIQIMDEIRILWYVPILWMMSHFSGSWRSMIWASSKTEVIVDKYGAILNSPYNCKCRKPYTLQSNPLSGSHYSFTLCIKCIKIVFDSYPTLMNHFLVALHNRTLVYACFTKTSSIYTFLC